MTQPKGLKYKKKLPTKYTSKKNQFIDLSKFQGV